METKIKFYGMSQNKKTGNISQTYTTSNTCPLRCPMRKYCYAKTGPARIHWNRVSEYGVTVDFLEDVIKNTAHTEIVRLNVAGDIAKENTSDIDGNLVSKYCDIFKNNNMQAYTYTHCDIENKNNIDIVKQAAENNVIINFSCETLKQIEKCQKEGVNSVLTVNSMEKHFIRKNGICFLQCPATYDKKITCKTCKMCMQANRKNVIVFPVHGNNKNKAIKDGVLIDLKENE